MAVDLAEMVKTLLLHPSDFFEAIDLNGSWLQPLLFLLPCIIVNALMNSIIGVNILDSLAKMAPDTAADIATFRGAFFASTFSVLSIGMLIGTFLVSLSVAIALHFLGGRGGFQATYRVLACSWIVLLVTWIPFIGLILGMYFFIPATIGLAKAHSVSRWKALAGLCVGPLILTVASTIIIVVFSGVGGFFIHDKESMWDRYGDSEIMRRYEKRE